jgi:pheromone shutdown protein TraB
MIAYCNQRAHQLVHRGFRHSVMMMMLLLLLLLLLLVAVAVQLLLLLLRASWSTCTGGPSGVGLRLSLSAELSGVIATPLNHFTSLCNQ